MIPSNLLPSDVKQWCIAGGWAACPAMASDQDVWVFGIDTSELDRRRSELLAHLGREFPLIYVSPQEETTEQDYDGINIIIKKVAVISHAGLFGGTPKKTHLMVTDAPSPLGILVGFDVSTHQLAIMPDGGIVRGPAWTSIDEQPLELLHNAKTPERMRKICERYGHPYKETAVGTTEEI